MILVKANKFLEDITGLFTSFRHPLTPESSKDTGVQEGKVWLCMIWKDLGILKVVMTHGATER